MNIDRFLKGNFSINPKKFFDGYVPLKPITYCIALIFNNGYRRDVYGITNPWMYMNAMKKNPKIKTCFIVEEITL